MRHSSGLSEFSVSVFSRRIGLRTTLLGLLAGSTALAMAAVATVALEETHAVLDDLGKDHFKTISIGVAAAVESELQRIPDAFHQERLLASVGEGLDIHVLLKEQLTAMALLLEPGAVIGYGDHRINLYARARRLPNGLVEVDEAFPDAFGQMVIEENVVSEGDVETTFEAPQPIDTEYEKTDWFQRGLRTESFPGPEPARSSPASSASRRSCPSSRTRRKGWPGSSTSTSRSTISNDG